MKYPVEAVDTVIPAPSGIELQIQEKSKESSFRNYSVRRMVSLARKR
jgi:hypothetical protein